MIKSTSSLFVTHKVYTVRDPYIFFYSLCSKDGVPVGFRMSSQSLKYNGHTDTSVMVMVPFTRGKLVSLRFL